MEGEVNLNIRDDNFIPILKPNEMYAQKVVHHYYYESHSPVCDCGNCDCFPYDTVFYGYLLKKKEREILVCKNCANTHGIKKITPIIDNLCNDNRIICNMCKKTCILIYEKNSQGKSLCVRCSSPYKRGVPGLKNTYSCNGYYYHYNNDDNDDDDNDNRDNDGWIKV